MSRFLPMPTPISTTKVCAPKLSGVVPRQRLFDQIDALRASGRRLVWLAGAPGSGKTTLATSYVEHLGARVLWLRADPADADPATLLAHLVAAAKQSGLSDAARLPPLTREHLVDAARYARLIFRALFAARPEPRIVVLDDAHTIAAHSACERIIAVLVEELPETWCMLATSREHPPDTLARLLVNGVAGEIPGASFAFSVDETRSLLRARNGRPEDAQALHDSTGGWAAALALRASLGAAACTAVAEGDARRQIDAYLNAEVFRALGDKERRGFMALAWLPAVRRGWAETLAVPPGALRRLEAMAANGILVQTYAIEGTESEYRFHTLFMGFLRERARQSCTGRQLLAVQRAVVALLQGSGMNEAALELTLEMRDWPQACELIVGLAPVALAAARQRSVIAWAEAVPASNRSAWLQFWLGQAQMFGNPTRGRENVRKAYEVFRQNADPAPRYRALAAIITTYNFEYSTQAPMSRWLAEFHALGMEYEAISDANVKAIAAVGVWSALHIRAPQHPDLVLWESRVHALLALDGDPNLAIRAAMLLGKHYWYTGQHPRIWPLAERVARALEQPGVHPYSRLVSYLLLVYDAWSRADPDRGRQATTQALEVAERSGVHLIDCHLQLHAACFALARADADAARLLDSAAAQHNPARRIEAWHLFISKAWQALLAQAHTRAIEYAAIALDAAEPIGPPPQCTALVGMCYALLGAGDTQELAPRLQRLARLAADTGNRWGLFQVHLIEARLAQHQGDTKLCHARLQEAFVIGRQNHLYSFLFAVPRLLSNLCGEALLAGIEPDYARELIRRQRLAPPEASALREDWPWALRIYTLGRFALVLDDSALVSRGKVQKKSLELLKALIALGGRDVDAGELADALWPDADGAAARSALDMSLHRLRKLLGREEAVVMRDAKLSLNPDVCWVDVWAFERGLGQLEAETAHASGAANGLATLHEKVHALHQGVFLASEPEHPWLLPPRERLRQRYLRVLLALGQQAESRSQWDEASVIYERGLEQDSVAEELYRRLMICHRQRGDHAAAVSAYWRCRDMLSVVLGVRPSAETEAVHRSIPRPEQSGRDFEPRDLAARKK